MSPLPSVGSGVPISNNREANCKGAGTQSWTPVLGEYTKVPTNMPPHSQCQQVSSGITTTLAIQRGLASFPQRVILLRIIPQLVILLGIKVASFHRIIFIWSRSITLVHSHCPSLSISILRVLNRASTPSSSSSKSPMARGYSNGLIASTSTHHSVRVRRQVHQLRHLALLAVLYLSFCLLILTARSNDDWPKMSHWLSSSK